MDVKAPLTNEKYSRACGVNAENLLEKIEKTIGLLLEGEVEYEFRTTVVSALHSRQDVEKVCQKIKGCRKYVIQNHKGDVEAIDPEFKNLKPFLEKDMKAFLTTARKIIPSAAVRGFLPLSL